MNYVIWIADKSGPILEEISDASFNEVKSNSRLTVAEDDGVYIVGDNTIYDMNVARNVLVKHIGEYALFALSEKRNKGKLRFNF